MPSDLAELIVLWRSHAELIERYGDVRGAKMLRACAVDAECAARLVWWGWISEDVLSKRTGRSAEWLRSHFEFWERANLARRRPGKGREYREVVGLCVGRMGAKVATVPRTAPDGRPLTDLEIAYAEGLAGARGERLPRRPKR